MSKRTPLFDDAQPASTADDARKIMKKLHPGFAGAKTLSEVCAMSDEAFLEMFPNALAVGRELLKLGHEEYIARREAADVANRFKGA